MHSMGGSPFSQSVKSPPATQFYPLHTPLSTPSEVYISFKTKYPLLLKMTPLYLNKFSTCGNMIKGLFFSAGQSVL